MKKLFTIVATIAIIVGITGLAGAQQARTAFMAGSIVDTTISPSMPITLGGSQLVADTVRTVDSLRIQTGYFIPYDYLQEIDRSIAKIAIGRFTPTTVKQNLWTSFYFYSDSLTSNPTLRYRFSNPLGINVNFDSTVFVNDTLLARFSFYLPDTMRHPVTLTLLATRANGVVADSQNIVITPELNPRPETRFFDLPNAQLLPDFTSRDYLLITDDTMGTQRRYFNGRLQRTRIVEVASIQSTIDEFANPTDDGNLYARFHSPDSVLNANIEQLNIYTDKLVVRSHFFVPGARIRIFARQVIFQDQSGTRPAAINNSGLNSFTITGQPLPGQDGGSMEIYAADLFVNGRRFISNGGKGSNAVAMSPSQTGQPAAPGGYGGRITSNTDLLTHVLSFGGAGGDTAAGYKSIPAHGQPGEVVTNNRNLAWLNANYLNLIQRYIDDLYFLNFRDSAYAWASRYSGYMNDAYISNQFSDLPDTLDQVDLTANLAGFTNTVNQIKSGLDIMGNPIGWVPMLSYQASAQAFDNQIGVVIQSVYLSQFVKRANQTYQARFTAIDNAVSGLRQQIQNDTSSMADIRRAVPLMDQKIATNQERIDSLQAQAKKVEDALQAKLRKAADAAAKRARIGGILKGIGSVAALLPIPGASVIGPSLAAFGTAYSASGPPTGGVSGYFKWGTSNFKSLSEGYSDARGRLPESMKNYRNLYSDIYKRGLCRSSDTSFKACLSQQADSIGKVLHPYGAAIAVFGEDADKKSVNEDDLKQKLAAAEAEDPEYSKLVNATASLQQETAQLHDQIKADNKHMQDLGQALTRQVNSAAYLSGARSAALGRIDMRMVQYVDQMEARNIRQLKYYLYLMARSWEYTTCTPFPGDLNVTNVFSRLRTMLDTNGTGAIPAAQLNALKAIFKQEIYDARDQIVSTFTTQGPGSTATTTLELLPNQLADLQTADPEVSTTTLLNIVRDNDFLPDNRENLRIKRIWIDTLWVQPTVQGHTFHPNVNFSVSVIYPNSGKIKKDGQIYSFVFGNSSNNFAISWDATLNARTGNLTQSAWDAGDICQSLVNGSFLQSCDASTIVTRPALDADIKIQLIRNGLLFDTVPHVVRKVRIGLEYYYRTRTNNKVFVAVQSLNSKQRIPFTFSRPDLNGRQGGFGPVARVYDPLATSSVVVTAPLRYGRYRFVRWEGSGGNPTNPSRTVPIQANSDVRVFARYERLVQKAIVPDTLFVTEDITASAYLPFRAGGNDELEYVIDSIQAFVPGFTLPQAKKGFLANGQRDSVLFTIPPTPTGTHVILGELFTFAPEDSQFVYKTIVLQRPLTIGIARPTTYKLNVVPNPNDGQFMVTVPNGMGIRTVQLTDMTGKVWDQLDVSLNGHTAYLNATGLQAGVYMVRVLGFDQQQYTARIVKQ